MDLITRAQWGAQPPRSVSTDIRPVGVTIHWEGPTMGVFQHSQCPAKARSIQAYHQDTQKWADVAYTAIVCPHGSVYECRGIGKRTAANGTNAGNASWYAVCALVGVGDQITPALLRGLDDAIGWLRSSGAGQAVNGHRDHKPTACPGDELYRWAHGPHDTTTPEDDMTEAEAVSAARSALSQMFDEAANRSTPTGRAFGDDLAKILGAAQPAPLDPVKFAAELAPHLGDAVDLATVEAGVRNVLGSLAPPPES